MGKDIFTIGEFVQKSGTGIRTLRYYDSIDLLKPSDYTEGGHRLYTKEDIITLQKIKCLQFLGLSLKDIKNMLKNHTVKGTAILQSLNDQKQLFEAKKLEIMNILTDIDHMIETIEEEETINIDIFCAMVQKLMFEEETERWFKEHYSKDVVNELLDINKSEKIDLDKKWTKILTQIKQLISTETPPSSMKSQKTIENLMLLVNETMKGNIDLFKETLPHTRPFPFPNPFTEKDLQFIKEAMEIYTNNNSSS
ncbi:MerR family transcriptional regulator [Paenibacillus sp. N3/727]|uniref:MerR family transcriptional regulator n=1 Tax=Paenibacillus sp. N3/727 TaxID=2925845 RepID=UPI001F52B9D8|nr:MerR family transcriptional regulator [Paenibacillus sp. N3/727]UNK19813.1 MerR family transcriptional regulator [Paenibacillus sp. N3/727]